MVYKVMDGAWQESARPPKNIPTGLNAVDEFLHGGLHPGCLHYIASRPGMGKTMLVTNIAYRVAEKNKYNVVYLSNQALEHQLDNIFVFTSYGSSAVLENPQRLYLKTSAFDFESEIKRLEVFAENNPIDLLIIDSMTSLKHDGDMRDVLIRLKEFAQSNGCAVLMTGGVNEDLDKRVNKRPYYLSEITEGDFVGHLCDLVIFLYRADYYYPETDEKNISQLLVVKNNVRFGIKATIELETNTPEYTVEDIGGFEKRKEERRISKSVEEPPF